MSSLGLASGACEFAPQERLTEHDVALYRRQRQSEDLSDLFAAESAEILHLDHFGLAPILMLQLLQSLVDHQESIGLFIRDGVGIFKLHLFAFALGGVAFASE